VSKAGITQRYFTQFSPVSSVTNYWASSK